MPDVTDLGLTTNQFIARISAEMGITVDRTTVTAWTRREDCPLPVTYRGKPGQSNRYAWETARPWLEAEFSRAKTQATKIEIDEADWFMARTIKERERAKQAQMDTMARGGELGSVREMELAAEDLGRMAVQLLRTIADRVAPLVAVESDEVRCAALISREIESVCNQVADAGARDA